MSGAGSDGRRVGRQDEALFAPELRPKRVALFSRRSRTAAGPGCAEPAAPGWEQRSELLPAVIPRSCLFQAWRSVRNGRRHKSHRKRPSDDGCWASARRERPGENLEAVVGSRRVGNLLGLLRGCRRGAELLPGFLCSQPLSLASPFSFPSLFLPCPLPFSYPFPFPFHFLSPFPSLSLFLSLPLSSPLPFPSLLISGPICLQTACKGATLPGPDGGCCEISPSIQTKNLLSPPPHADLRVKKFPWVSCSQLDVACSRTQNLLWGARRAGVEQSSCTARPCPRSVLLQYTLTKIESHFISIQQQRKRNPPPQKKNQFSVLLALLT